jgi:hypothetical protein
MKCQPIFNVGQQRGGKVAVCLREISINDKRMAALPAAGSNVWNYPKNRHL